MEILPSILPVVPSPIKVWQRDSASLSLHQFRRTPIGALPEILLQRLGLFDPVIHALRGKVTPWCVVCSKAVPTVHVDAALDTAFLEVGERTDGYLAVAVPGTLDVELSFQMELLDVERAVIDRHLVHRDMVHNQCGMPVLLLGPVKARGEFRSVVFDWFGRGGESATLFWFSSREALGVEIGRIQRSPRCSECGAVVGPYDPEVFMESPACQRCRGKGWVSTTGTSSSDLLRACLDCDGAGSSVEMSKYTVAEIPLTHLMQMEHQRLYDIIKDDLEGGRNAVVRHAARCFQFLVQSPFSKYPLGAPVAAFTTAEKALLVALQAQIIGFQRRQLYFDLAALRLLDKDSIEFIREVGTQANVGTSQVGQPTLRNQFSSLRSGCAATNQKPECWIRVVNEKTLLCDRIAFPFQGLTLVIGPPGSGKTTLLRDVIESHFVRRRKLGDRCDFNGCTEVVYLAAPEVIPAVVGDLVGVSDYIASLFSSTAAAHRIGLSARDFVISRASTACALCGGVGEEECVYCRGMVLDSRLSLVKVGSVSFSEVTQIPISEVSNSLVLDSVVEDTLQAVSRYVPAATSLSTSSAQLSEAEARFIYLYARLKLLCMKHSERKGRRRGALKSRVLLLLLDCPFIGDSELDSILYEQLGEVQASGGTVVCTDSVERYASSFDRVTELVPDNRDDDVRQYFHERVCRVFTTI